MIFYSLSTLFGDVFAEEKNYCNCVETVCSENPGKVNCIYDESTKKCKCDDEDGGYWTYKTLKKTECVKSSDAPCSVSCDPNNCGGKYCPTTECEGGYFIRYIGCFNPQPDKKICNYCEEGY